MCRAAKKRARTDARWYSEHGQQLEQLAAGLTHHARKEMSYKK
jgi:hypothetical protein